MTQGKDLCKDFQITGCREGRASILTQGPSRFNRRLECRKPADRRRSNGETEACQRAICAEGYTPASQNGYTVQGMLAASGASWPAQKTPLLEVLSCVFRTPMNRIWLGQQRSNIISQTLVVLIYKNLLASRCDRLACQMGLIIPASWVCMRFQLKSLCKAISIELN